MNQQDIDDYKKAGKIAAQALEYTRKLVKPGVSLLETIELAEEKVLSLGGDFAFPPQISLNDTAAHFCPTIDDTIVYKEGDVAKVDIGVHIDGCVGDNAVTVVLGNNEKLKLLAQASKDALNNALKIIRPGTKISDIGKTIQSTIEETGFVAVTNLSGHGLARFTVHDKPSIPNFATASNDVLKEGQAIAVEPFASTGSGVVYESGTATIYSVSQVKQARSPMTREVLKTIEGYKGLPFTNRWLVKKHGAGKTAFALREIRSMGILREYPPLPDTNHGMVSQHEHTVLVLDKPIITTKLD